MFRKYKPDVFVATDGYLSLSSEIKTLAVFHDLNFEHYPKDLPFFNRAYYRHFFPRYAKNAKRIAAVSSFTKSDIVKTYHIDPTKIDVVYNGANEKFVPVNDSIKQEVRIKFSDGKPYFLFVGSLHQRKNIASLLKAFDQFCSAVNSDMQLVLAGQKRWWTTEMEDAYQSMSQKERVIFTGRMSEEDLYRVTASAFALTYVSVFEGFGIPIVEAMRCGVPVITSDTTAMPEIAGDAALLCNPFSVDSIAGAMQKIFSDDLLRNDLIKRGKERCKVFTWQSTAENLWRSILLTADSTR